MDARYFSLFDMAIGGIPVLVFCIWQLVSVNREIATDKKNAEPKAGDASPESTGHAIGEHRLDDR